MYRLVNHDVHIDGININYLLNTNNTRFAQRNNLLLPKARTNYGKFTTAFGGISPWNTIPTEIKTSCNVHSFSHLTKRYLLDALHDFP